jgi:hypothetical protein
MSSSDRTDPAASKGPATYIVDAVVAVIVFFIGAVVIFGSRKLGAEWTSDGPGSGYFPFYIGLIMCISGAGVFYQALISKTAKRNTDVFVDDVQLKRVLSVLLPAAAYVLAVQFIGLYIASAIYIALFMVILGKFSFFKSVSIALCVNVLFFLMFEVWFKVPLFKGAYDMLSFLGY